MRQSWGQVSGLVMAACLAAAVGPWQARAAELSTYSTRGSVPVKSWKEARDEGIIKQSLDYSCGAASTATILRHYYKLNVTEVDVLHQLTVRTTTIKKDDKGKFIGYSFDDLATVVGAWSMNAGGLALSFEDLKKLTVPVIVYLQYRGEEHFSVLRGVAPTGIVHLADPAWGNRRFTEAQFREMWETRPDPKAPGKILLIMPKKIDPSKLNASYYKAPEDWSALFTSLSMWKP